MKKNLKSLKMLVWVLLFFPLCIRAHDLSIVPTTPISSSMQALSSMVVTFTVTNTTNTLNVTPIDQSLFPSYITMTSSTCRTVLYPHQSCTVQVTINAPSFLTEVKGQLRFQASPTADATSYPIAIACTAAIPQIKIAPIANSGLPAVREPVVGQYAGSWLLVSASEENFHNFSSPFISSIYVYNPETGAIYSASPSALPLAVQHQFNSSDVVFYQDDDTLYLIGGFYTADNTTWSTLDTVTAINVPGMINAVMNGGSLTPYVATTSVSEFRITGGQLGKIGGHFYPAFGQLCSDTDYCDPITGQGTYTDTIYQFTMEPTLSSVHIVNQVTHPDLDNSGWRRRDYTLAPLIYQGSEALLAEAGPFTQGNNAAVWTNAILIQAGITTKSQFLTQQANQYFAPVLSMFSEKSGFSYVATFSGLSNLYWGENGLTYDSTTPYGNILDLISVDGEGHAQEYANFTPLCSGNSIANCIYMGLSAIFIPNKGSSSYFGARNILQLDNLPPDQSTLVGYLYGGLVSNGQDIFGASPNAVSSQIYAVYVNPTGVGSDWSNVTNMYTGSG